MNTPSPTDQPRDLTQRMRAVFTKKNWRRHRKWLVFLPVIPIVAVLLIYDSVVMGFTPPPQIILAPKGLEILDRNGELLYTFDQDPGSNQITALSDVSPALVAATVATEDSNFWNNPGGLSPKGILRATYENVAFWKNGGLFKGSGGSSITQQLAKNLYIDPKDRATRSPIRKMKEAMYAFELNRRYSKEQILAWYLSVVNYGHGAYGIQAASYRYFNKAPKDLTLAEASMLAGLPKAPALYDPFVDPAKASERQKQVLTLMTKQGVINPQQASEALSAQVRVQEGKVPGELEAKTPQIAPHFAQYVRDQLPALVGTGALQGKLRVTTSLDANLQRQAESTVKSQLDKFEKSVGASNGALVSMDPKTGEILAMVGSHDFSRVDISGQVNNALSLNEPGSTMKPITYVTAFMQGWSPSTMVTDEPLKIGDGADAFTLGNADKKYRGAVPVRTALGSSLNVPAVKALQFAGLPNVYNMARRLGVTSLRDMSNYGPAFTLGGVDVDLLDMTYVYSVFAGYGEQAGMPTMQDLPKGSRNLDPVAVLAVQSAGGKMIYRVSEHRDRILPAAATYLVTNVLSDDSARVSMFGANSAMNLPGRPAAVKSGSSDDTRDLLAIGYTPQLVTGVWVGNADNKPMTGTSSTVAAPIWQAFMTAALKDKPAVDFPIPDGVEFAKVCATTGQAPASNCPKVVTEVFLSGHVPSGAKTDKPGAVATPVKSVPSQPQIALQPTQPPAPPPAPTLAPVQPTPPMSPIPVGTPQVTPQAQQGQSGGLITPTPQPATGKPGTNPTVVPITPPPQGFQPLSRPST